MALVIPPELLWKIIGHAVAQYIDDLFSDPLAFAHSAPTGSSRTLLDGWNDKLISDDVVLLTANPIIELLRTSFAVRQITLDIVSDALGIPLKACSTCANLRLCVILISFGWTAR